MVGFVQAEQERTGIPRVEPETEVVPAGDASPEPERGNGRRRRPAPANEPSATSEPVDDFAEPPVRPAGESVTEVQLVRAFYWMYRGWCKLLGAQVDAQQADFQDLGKAWLDLARKVPGIRWLIAFAGPIFTLTDLVDKLATAWTARTRFRERFRMPPSWRQRSQSGAEAPEPDANGGTGAP